MELRFFTVVGITMIILAEAFRWLVNKKGTKENSYRYQKLRMVLIYLGELLSFFGLFSIVATNPRSPFNYEETSSLKMFLDFAAWYQISIFISLKTYDSIQANSYQKARHLCGMLTHLFEEAKFKEAKLLIKNVQRDLVMPDSINTAFEKFETLASSLLNQQSENATESSKIATRVVETYIIELDARIEILQSQATGSILLRRLYKFKE